MNNIEKWIDSIFENTIPNEVVGIAFNLYEDETNQWSIEMIGSASSMLKILIGLVMKYLTQGTIRYHGYRTQHGKMFCKKR